MSKTIELSKGLVTVVDDADYELLSQYKWHAAIDRYGKYYAHRIERFGGKISHVIMGRQLTGASGHGQIVKYRNDDTLDNRRENLILRLRKREAHETAMEPSS